MKKRIRLTISWFSMLLLVLQVLPSINLSVVMAEDMDDAVSDSYSDDEQDVSILNYHGEDEIVIESIEEQIRIAPEILDNLENPEYEADDVEEEQELLVPIFITEKESQKATEESDIESEDVELISSDMEHLETVSIDSVYQSPYITSVKNQGSYGTCWAHAFMAVAEANLVRQELAESDVDLSEYQLAYFMYHPVTDALGGLGGDEFTWKTSYESHYIDVGGNQQLATYHVASWQGLADELTAPYTSISINNDDPEQDSSLDLELAYDQDVVHLKNAYWISLQDQDYVKAAIQEYGAAAASYYHSANYYNQNNIHYCTSPLAEYCPSSVSTNHAITIVGWDDTFSKENFGTYQPEQDGAWLCKNSWGTAFGQDGYFWISYEDAPLLNGFAYVYEMDEADNYDYNYQYDGAYGSAHYVAPYNKQEANVYTASSDQTLKAVGFYTANPAYDYTIRIYVECQTGTPVGELMTTQTGSQLYAGFHTVELDTPILLREGETFSVVIDQAAQDESETVIYIDAGNIDSNWYSAVSSASSGQSYIGNGESWYDVSRQSYNCRIKAYTDDRIPDESEEEDEESGKEDLNEENLDGEDTDDEESGGEDPKDDDEPVIIYVDTIEIISPVEQLVVGDTYTFTALVLPDDADDTDIIWSSDAEDVLSIDEASGYAKALSAGTATITCTAADGNGASDSLQITIEEPDVSVTSIILNETEQQLVPGQSYALEATVMPENATDQNVIWTSSDPSIAEVTDEGIVTAKAAGTTTITCTAADGSSVKAACKVTVKQPVTKITLNKTSAGLFIGKTLTISAAVTPTTASNRTVTWKSSNTSVATVTAKGVVTAKAVGTATITCTAADGSGVKATCKITVTKPITKITLNKTSAKIFIGKTVTLKSTVSPSNATNRNVTWKSSNTSVATVSSAGVVTGKKAGTATITCTAKDGSGVKATCKITVTKPVTKITLNKAAASIKAGKTVKLSAAVTPTNATDRSVIWSSSNTSIATVSSTGVVTAKKAGTVTITCKAKDGSGVKATCKITVK